MPPALSSYPQPQPMRPLAIRAWTATTALGRGRAAQLSALRERRSGLRPNAFGPLADGTPLACWTGRVDGLEALPLPRALAQWECRNNRLAWLALQQDGMQDAIAAASARHGADRIAIVLGTSTSSIGASEQLLPPKPKELFMA